jgi:hypothetical protein
MATFYVHAPNEKLHYESDWSNAIESGVTITTSLWAIAPTGPILSGTGFVGDVTYVDVAGCVLGVDYTLTNTIILSNGETYIDSLFLFLEVK